MKTLKQRKKELDFVGEYLKENNNTPLSINIENIKNSLRHIMF